MIPKGTIKQLGYGGGPPPSKIEQPTGFRVERGFPFQRAGKTVVAVPQFKGLQLYAHTTATALNSFATTTPVVTIAWPTSI